MLCTIAVVSLLAIIIWQVAQAFKSGKRALALATVVLMLGGLWTFLTIAAGPWLISSGQPYVEVKRRVFSYSFYFGMLIELCGFIGLIYAYYRQRSRHQISHQPHEREGDWPPAPKL